jgi:hypothetical protein
MSIATTGVRIKAVIAHVTPEVMRRIAVPLAIRLDRLHLTLQAAFGWTNSHLYAFHGAGMSWGVLDPDFAEAMGDVSKTRLYDIVRDTGAKTIRHTYDFGDNWEHVVKLEEWVEYTSTEGLPLLLDAKGRCPPEDVGGPPGYEHFLAALSDPAHPGARRYAPLDWRRLQCQWPRPQNARRRCRCAGAQMEAKTPKRLRGNRQAEFKRVTELRLPQKCCDDRLNLPNISPSKYTERLLEAGIEPSVGSVGDSYDNALAETVNGLCKAEIIWRRGPWRGIEAVEIAALEWVDWFNRRRLLEPIGYMAPAEAEANYYAALQHAAIAA